MLNSGRPPDFAMAFQMAWSKAAASTRLTRRGDTRGNVATAQLAVKSRSPRSSRRSSPTLMRMRLSGKARAGLPVNTGPGAGHRPLPRTAGPAGAGYREQLSVRRGSGSRAYASTPGFLDHVPHRCRAVAGGKVLTPKRLPACDEPCVDGVGKVAAFSLHAWVAGRADGRKKLGTVIVPWREICRACLE